MSAGTRFLSAVLPLAYAARMPQRRTNAAPATRSRPVSAARFPTPEAAAAAVEEALQLIKGRWKLLILFHLFGGQVRRFSALERTIPWRVAEDADATIAAAREGWPRSPGDLSGGPSQG
jgi:hypothetical protein